ncbi:MAG: transcription elongation factor GreB [Bdellovibrionales bacterium]
MEKKNYMTPDGYQRLKSEYQDLYSVERPKVVETVAWAASNGDRSENADYQYGKRRLREIDRRLHFLTDRLETALVVDPKKARTDQVVFGVHVTILDENGKSHTYQIVGADEYDPSRGKISWISPMAKALLGKKVGDLVILNKPSGSEEIEIEKIFIG